MADVIQARGRIDGNLAKVYDAEGKEIKFDIREDEEQNIKFQETIELLVAAGYFPARIKALSAFDRVVGGMVWCIATCDVDVDVDLLYKENATIGQKIALTEKIVKVLPKIKCPFAIQPHQIQGLDFIHIFPVIQWLVKQAIKFREENGDAVQMLATSQYDLHYDWPTDKPEKISTLPKFLPKRIYKRLQQSEIADQYSRILCTLIEYGSRTNASAASEAKAEESKAASKNAEQQMDSLMAGMAVIDEKLSSTASSIVSAIDKNQIKQMSEKIAQEFGTALPSLGILNESVRETLTESLQTQKSELQSNLSQITDKVERLKEQLTTDKLKYEDFKRQEAEMDEQLEQLDNHATSVDEETTAAVENLLLQREELKKREREFKKRCKDDVESAQSELLALQQRLSSVDRSDEGLRKLLARHHQVETILKETRLDASTINRKIAAFQRRIDDVPSRAELNQYQRRFVELYNQIATKHKDTKRFYTLFNTLQDVKTYMEKEVTLLNSVYDNYQAALQSENNKLQFSKQLEQMVDSIKQTHLRIEKQEMDKKSKRDSLREAYQELLNKQRLYYKTVKDFQEECRRNELIMTKAKESGLDIFREDDA